MNIGRTLIVALLLQFTKITVGEDEVKVLPMATNYSNTKHDKMILSGNSSESHVESSRSKRSPKHKFQYKPTLPKKCHPQTVTKFKTVYKERKANIHNQVEILNPKPNVKKVVETRYTTIRYPVFITQVIKPVLTQVETKVKPIFFTETVKKFTTVLFTVTGIGQVTVTKLKYETEYITRCLKKGYHHRSDPPIPHLHPDIQLPGQYDFNEKELVVIPSPPPGLPYDETIQKLSPKILTDVHEIEGPSDLEILSNISRNHKIPYIDEQMLPPPEPENDPNHNQNEWVDTNAPLPITNINLEAVLEEMKQQNYPVTPIRRRPIRVRNRPRRPGWRRPPNLNTNSRRQGDYNNFPGHIGDVQDLYNTDIYYQMGRKDRGGRQYLFSSEESEDLLLSYYAHPPLLSLPKRVLY